MIFFTSDTHYHHANIIKYSNRPYKNVEEMNQALIDNWNRVVGPKDTVYHLGDVSFGRELKELNYLNGYKVFILGNHDKYFVENCKKEGKNYEIKNYAEISYMNEKLILFHFPLLTWNKARYGSFQLHGHIHSKVPIYSNVRRYDVGVDANNYTPVSIEQIIESFKNFRGSPMSNPDETPPLRESKEARGKFEP